MRHPVYKVVKICYPNAFHLERVENIFSLNDGHLNPKKYIYQYFIGRQHLAYANYVSHYNNTPRTSKNTMTANTNLYFSYKITCNITLIVLVNFKYTFLFTT